MSYFDHVSCSSCNAKVNPESIGGRGGMNCPNCGNELRLPDLFGLKDAFQEEDDDNMSIDDLVGSSSGRSSRSQPVNVAPEEGVSALELMRRMKKK